ncbi:MAG TPA: adenylate/guanylate cyclase domain-containing protein [Alphaproteobacteria bacterium]|jgi:class 3 adenylate cyclase/TolB-like protein
MGAEPVQRRLAAILAGDVAGYSRLMGADEVGTLAALKAHRAEAIDPRLAHYNGRVVKTTGDGILIEFPSVVDAVQCAVAIQDEMRARNAEVAPEKRIAFRIGINVGDVIIEGGDVFGDGVNIAARLEQLAEPGGICISRAAYEQVRDKLAFKFQDCGQQTVKNIARPIRVYRFSAEGTPPTPARRKRRVIEAAALAAILVAAVGAGAWVTLPILRAMVADQPPRLGTPRLSIAVLPFANLSGDNAQDYFADALTEDLTADLSRISGSFVIARSTAATYRGQNVEAKRIARELKVRYLLEGSVRRAEREVRVNVRLVDGESGQQVWSERYEKSASDMFAFQNEVTGRIARALNLELKEAVSRQAARRRAGNLDADDYALRAWAELWTKPQTRETNDAALAFVAKSLALDPDNAEAHGVAANAYARAAVYGWGFARADAIRLGIAAGEKAVAIDPKNADAVYGLAFLYTLAGEVARSQHLLRQCMEVNRNHAPAYFFYGLNLIRLGRPRETVAWIERAFALSPRDPLRSVWYGAIGRARIAFGDDALAIEAARQGIAANRDHPHNYAALASALAHLGRMDEAKAALQDFLRVQPGITVALYRRNVTSNEPVAVKANERLMTGLAKAGLPD